MSYTRLEMGACLNCGQRLTSAGRVPHDDEKPEPGSIMVCIYCSHAMEWDGAKLTPMSDEAIKEMAGDKELLNAVAFTGAFQRSKP
jgi:hypothetical protein